MFDVQWMGPIGTGFADASLSWLPGLPLVSLVDVCVWFTAVAGLGLLLGGIRSRGRSDRGDTERRPSVRPRRAATDLAGA
jgi:hypothetical protein